MTDGAQRLLRDSNVIDKEFLTADAALEKRKAMLRCFPQALGLLTSLFLGGIETQAVTQFYGEFQYREITDMPHIVCYG